ncbi:aspartic proteinase NANA, chloroplast isoform X2 [Lotus japonicus]|uniref:aspartic proteinase NANA, chloroplast isoform X2 n=1 Tax=Lotus japonicus TaxID=34305 RepID=UPI002583547F|nr:aspartic proteinase NANA, chloroplast isoform X2 [Lotus japonicus]
MQMWRGMKWCNPNLIILLLIPIIVVVHGFNDLEEEEVQGMSMELVHRHDARRFAGEVDQVEAIKGFILRDTLRRQSMNQRFGLRNSNNGSHRRKDSEMVQFQLPMHSGRDYGLGEYFVQVKVGTPGQKFWLAADTGSEFTWFNSVHKTHNKTQTKNHGGGGHKKHKGKLRKRGKKVRHNNPCNGVFCPQRSRTFKTVTCSSRKCKVELSDLFSLTYCPKPSDPCLYDISYVDGSSAKGFFGSDTITVELSNGRKGKLHNLTIGCTKTIVNGVTFNEDTGGILGLGYAKDAFVDKAALQYGGKFSYCLVDHLSHQNVSSYLTFGTPKVKLLSEMRRTELFLAAPFYGVNVVGISVGGQMLKIPSQVWDFNAQGGTIIDSGTTLTNLALPAYEQLFEALKKSLTKVKRVPAGDFGGLDYCFDAKGFDESSVPRLVFHFAGGVRFEPPVKSYIIDVAPQVKCIGVLAINGPGASVIGNIMQQNHLWEFDLAHNTVGFAPSACN